MVINPVFPSWLIILIVFMLTIFLVWQELRKTQRFLIPRLAALLLMMCALLGMLLRPGFERKKSSSIVLLTPGYQKHKVDSILSHIPHATVMHLEGVSPYKSSTTVDESALVQRYREIQFVLGDGLPRKYLDQMSDATFSFIPSPLPKGITNLLIPKENVAGRQTSIMGVLNSTDENYWIYLEGPGGKEDSAQIHKKGLNEFILSFTPKRDGKFVYHLLIGNNTDTSREPLPVFVENQRKLNLLFLQSYPTFEIQTLKNFLGQKGHSVIVRNQISKNNFRSEYINRDAVQMNRLSSALLGDTDLIIADEKSLATLTSAEKNILAEAVRSGLGLLNLSTTSAKKETLFPFQTTTVRKDTTTIVIRSMPFTLPASNIRVIPNSSLVPILKNRSGLLSGYGFLGAGKIGFHLLQETYQISLSGDSSTYAALWTPLLEHTSRPKNEASKINITTRFPWYVDEQIDIEVISSTADVSLQADSIRLPLAEDVGVDNVWHTRTWPHEPGWHLLQTNDGTSLNYYVARADDWRSLNVTNQQRANTIHKSGNAEPSSEIEITEEVPPLIFYLTFLLSAGFLWLAPKL